MNNLYTIHNLNCKYPGSIHPVLNIEHLTIRQGSIVFFIGPSGVGKSTILETLGLMSYTLDPGDSCEFQFCYDGTQQDLLTIWKKSEREISRFRSQHLSFIFQSTNLFQNLTAYQNACVSQVLQGKHLQDAELHARQIFKKIFPEGERIIQDIVNGKKITQMSGGQRQRLAFVRAISTDFHVLFADEPTGNLDPANADNLMNMLTSNVRELGKTAIIVSHDISLAVKYADEIVFIDKQKSDEFGYEYGYIGQRSVYRKNIENGQWSTFSNERMTDVEFQTALRLKLNPEK